MSILLQSLKIIHKVFVATSTFCVKKRVTVKAQFPFFRAVSLVLAGFSFRGGGGNGRWVIILRGFEMFLIFPNFVGSQVLCCSATRDALVYTILLLIFALRFTCGERKNSLNYQGVSQYYEHDCSFE